MTYTTEIIQERLEATGELMIVLESDREYELHLHDTEFRHEDGIVETTGMIDGEYVVTQFFASRVEHTYIHKES